MKDCVCTTKAGPCAEHQHLYRAWRAEALEEAANLVCGLDHCDLNGHSCTTEIRDRIRALKSDSIYGIKIATDPTLKPGEWRLEKP